MVTRLVLGLCFVFAASVFAFALATRRPPQPEDGRGIAREPAAEVLFERHCGACHTVAEVVLELRRTPSSGRAARLSDFLSGHGDAPGADARRLSAFLADEADR